MGRKIMDLVGRRFGRLTVIKEKEVATMAMTEAQKRAALKYQKSLGQFSIKIPKPELERYKRAAEKTGMTFRAWVLKAMDNASNDTDYKIHTSDKKAREAL